MTPEEALHVIEESARAAEASSGREQQHRLPGWGERMMRYEAHAAACREAAATLRPPQGCVFVAVSRELLPRLAEWSEPMRLLVTHDDGWRVELLMVARNMAEPEAWESA